MDLSDAMRVRIYDLLKENNIGIWKLCEKTGIPCSTITTFLNGRTRFPKMDTLLHICEGLNISLSKFFDDKVFNDVISD